MLSVGFIFGEHSIWKMRMIRRVWEILRFKQIPLKDGKLHFLFLLVPETIPSDVNMNCWLIGKNSHFQLILFTN